MDFYSLGFRDCFGFRASDIEFIRGAEIIPVEPDPDHAGAREVETISSVPAGPGRFFIGGHMKLTVNGKPHEHQDGGSLAALLDGLGANPAHTALMLNGAVVPADRWEETQLKEEDNVEILVFVGGG
jgi:thiamine biosynthesis protein ThiS